MTFPFRNGHSAPVTTTSEKVARVSCSAQRIQGRKKLMFMVITQHDLEMSKSACEIRFLPFPFALKPATTQVPKFAGGTW
jgi:hypothetical protein